MQIAVNYKDIVDERDNTWLSIWKSNLDNMKQSVELLTYMRTTLEYQEYLYKSMELEKNDSTMTPYTSIMKVWLDMLPRCSDNFRNPFSMYVICKVMVFCFY